MNNLDKLAMMFAARDNPTLVGMTTGTVIGIDPLRIQYGDGIVLEPRHLAVSYSLLNGYTGQYTDSNGSSSTTKEVTCKYELQAGDKVMMIPDNALKKWYVIDKVVSP
jgi:hypothetical protein